MQKEDGIASDLATALLILVVLGGFASLLLVAGAAWLLPDAEAAGRTAMAPPVQPPRPDTPPDNATAAAAARSNLSPHECRLLAGGLANSAEWLDYCDELEAAQEQRAIARKQHYANAGAMLGTLFAAVLVIAVAAILKDSYRGYA